MASRLALVVLLVALGVAAAAAAKARPNFGDFLAASSADGKKAGPSSAPAYEYEEVEADETCLKAITASNCDSTDDIYFESGLGCCTKGDYHRDMKNMLETPTEVGSCHYTMFQLNNWVEINDKVERAATFIATCTLNSESARCGHPFCDKVVLSVQGEVYFVEDAIVTSYGDAPTLDDDCKNFDRQAGDGAKAPANKLSKMFNKKSGQKQAEVPAKPTYDREGYYEPKLFKVETAFVFYGTFTVTSRLHAIKTSGGWFEFVAAIYGDAEPVEHRAYSDHYVLDPYTYKLSFIKNKGY